jgi:hypothetical protein
VITLTFYMPKNLNQKFNDDEEEFDYDREDVEYWLSPEDDGHEFEFDCGYDPESKICGHIGSELCDFECPYRDQYLG